MSPGGHAPWSSGTGTRTPFADLKDPPLTHRGYRHSVGEWLPFNPTLIFVGQPEDRVGIEPTTCGVRTRCTTCMYFRSMFGLSSKVGMVGVEPTLTGFSNLRLYRLVYIPM